MTISLDILDKKSYGTPRHKGAVRRKRRTGMSKSEKKIHVQDKCANVPGKGTNPQPAPAPAPQAAPPPPMDPVEAAVASKPRAKDVLAKLNLDGLSPEEKAVLEKRLGGAKKADGEKTKSDVQERFNLAEKAVTAALSGLHLTLTGYGFDMPFEVAIGTGLDGKPFIACKRLRHRRTADEIAAEKAAAEKKGA